MRTTYKEGNGCSTPIVCSFFCLESDERTQRQELILCSIIYQVLRQDPSLANTLRRDRRYAHLQNSYTESAQHLWRILSILSSGLKSGRLYLVLDGLDEMKQQDLDPFLEELVRFTSRNTSVSVFTTSRPEVEIRRKFDRVSIIKYNLGQSANNRFDVLSFLADTIEDYAGEHDFEEQSKQTLLSAFQERSDGLFLWATLAWRHFTTGVGTWSKAALQKKIAQLQKLPNGMNALYYRILLSIDPDLHEELQHILRWLVVARRPLSFEELSVALALNERPRTCEDIKNHKRWSIRPFLENNCPYLVEIDQERGVFSVVHQSFKDFLLHTTEVNIQGEIVPNKFHMEFAEADSKSGCECLTYIGLEDFQTEAVLGKNVTGWRHMDPDLLKRYPFLGYARRYWPYHLQSGDDPDEVWKAFERIVSSGSNYKILCMAVDNYAKVEFDPPIFTAFKHRLNNMLKRLLVGGHDIDQRDSEGDQILHCCTLNPNNPDIEFLLSLGADINGRDRHGQTILLRLVRHSGIRGLQAWLDRPGVDINAQDRDGYAPLHAVVLMDPTPAIPLLDFLISQHQADVNIRDSKGRTPLTLAIHWGKESVTKALLGKANTKIESAGMGEESPLVNAAKQGWTTLLYNLLQQLESVDEFLDPDGQSILHWTVRIGLDEFLAIALSKQTSLVNAADNKGMTALHLAAEEGALKAVELLLRSGGDPTQKTAHGALPLHLAARKGHTPMVELLLNNMPSSMVNSRDSLGCTVAHWATTSGNDGLIKALAKKEHLDFTLKNNTGRTPIALAAEHASLEGFKAMLRAADAQITQIDYFGNTLIHLAAGMSNEPNTMYLISRVELDRNARNRFGKTALDRAGAISRDSEFYMALVDAGLHHSPLYAKSMLLASERQLYERSKRPEIFHEEWAINFIASFSSSESTP